MVGRWEDTIPDKKSVAVLVLNRAFVAEVANKADLLGICWTLQLYKQFFVPNCHLFLYRLTVQTGRDEC